MVLLTSKQAKRGKMESECRETEMCLVPSFGTEYKKVFESGV